MNTSQFIIPAIDLIDGKCVRLTEGDYTQKKVYHENPLEVAKAFEAIGVERLHLVDLDGAKAGKVINWKVLEQIATNTSLKIDFGGGVKHISDVTTILNSGAQWVTVGSIAAKQPLVFSEWIELLGADQFFLGADVKDEKITVGGWLETTELDVFSFIKNYKQKGINYIFCTDVSKDGKLQGPSIELYKKIIHQIPNVNLIASGGVSSNEDIDALKLIGCAGVIVGKAIYEGRLDLKKILN